MRAALAPRNPVLSSRRLSVIYCAGHPAEYNFSFDFSYNSFVPEDDPVYATQQQLWTDIGDGILTNAYNGALFMSMLAWRFLSRSLCSKVILVGEPAGFVPNTPPTFRLVWTASLQGTRKRKLVLLRQLLSGCGDSSSSFCYI